MDASRFDSWTRAIGTRSGRRALLRGIAGSAVAFGAVGLVADRTDAKKKKKCDKKTKQKCAKQGRICDDWQMHLRPLQGMLGELRRQRRLREFSPLRGGNRLHRRRVRRLRRMHHQCAVRREVPRPGGRPGVRSVSRADLCHGAVRQGGGPLRHEVWGGLRQRRRPGHAGCTRRGPLGACYGQRGPRSVKRGMVSVSGTCWPSFTTTALPVRSRVNRLPARARRRR